MRYEVDSKVSYKTGGGQQNFDFYDLQEKELIEDTLDYTDSWLLKGLIKSLSDVKSIFYKIKIDGKVEYEGERTIDKIKQKSK